MEMMDGHIVGLDMLEGGYSKMAMIAKKEFVL